jgi:hypothetical protein
VFEANFFISPQLVNDAILGCQFMKDYGINLNFDKGNFSYFKGNEVKEHTFYQTPGTVKSEHREQCCEKIPTPYATHTSRLHLIAPADRSLSTTPIETRDLQLPSASPPRLAMGLVNNGEIDKAGELHVKAVQTRVVCDVNEHSMFGVNSMSEFYDIKGLSAHNDKEENDDDVDDNIDEVSSPRGGYSTCDAVASVRVDASPEREPTLVSPTHPHPRQESTDSRLLGEAQLSSLIERKGNTNADQKASLCRVLTSN